MKTLSIGLLSFLLALCSISALADTTIIVEDNDPVIARPAEVYAPAREVIVPHEVVAPSNYYYTTDYTDSAHYVRPVVEPYYYDDYNYDYNYDHNCDNCNYDYNYDNCNYDYNY